MSFSPNACVTNLIRVHDGLVRLQVRLDAGSLDHEAGQYTTLGLDGQVFSLFLIVLAAAEAAVALAIVLNFYNNHLTVDVDRGNKLKG